MTAAALEDEALQWAGIGGELRLRGSWLTACGRGSPIASRVPFAASVESAASRHHFGSDPQPTMSLARIELTEQQGGRLIRLSGRWTLATTSQRATELAAEMDVAANGDGTWDCTSIEAIDSAGAMLLWRGWGRAPSRPCC
jgi:hypothetical protein